MGNKLYDKRIRVLAFNPLKRLIAIFNSCTSAATALGTSTVNIYYACTGQSISACNLYFRFLDESKVEIELLKNLGTLNLEDFDNLMGLKRRYYPTKDMRRLGATHISNNNTKDED